MQEISTLPNACKFEISEGCTNWALQVFAILLKKVYIISYVLDWAFQLLFIYLFLGLNQGICPQYLLDYIVHISSPYDKSPFFFSIS